MENPAFTETPLRSIDDVLDNTQNSYSRELRLWLRLFSTTNQINSEIKQRLLREFKISLVQFQFLNQLYCTRSGLNFGEISRLLMITKGSVTGLFAQLTKEGLVTRQKIDHDGRTTRIMLTTNGLALFATILRSMEAWLAEMFSGISPAEISLMLVSLRSAKCSIATHLTWKNYKNIDRQKPNINNGKKRNR